MALAELAAEDDRLEHAVLNLLVEVGPRQSQHEAVGPGLARQAELALHGLVVVLVVEAAHVFRFAAVDGAGGEVLDRGVDPVVVVGVVLESVDLPRQSAAEGLARIDVALVRIKGAVGVGGVHEPAAALLGGDDVDDAAQRVGAEAHGDYALVHLDTLGKVHRYVVQVERLPDAFLRYAVDEHLDVLARESVERHLHVRAHAARLPELQSGQGRQGVGQVFRRVLQGARVDGHDVVGRLPDAADAPRRHARLAQFAVGGFEPDVHLFRFVRHQPHGGFRCAVPHGRDDERVAAGRRFEAERAFGVGRDGVAGFFEPDRGKGDALGRMSFRDAAGHDGLADGLCGRCGRCQPKGDERGAT